MKATNAIINIGPSYKKEIGGFSFQFYIPEIRLGKDGIRCALDTTVCFNHGPANKERHWYAAAFCVLGFGLGIGYVNEGTWAYQKEETA